MWKLHGVSGSWFWFDPGGCWGFFGKWNSFRSLFVSHFLSIFCLSDHSIFAKCEMLNLAKFVWAKKSFWKRQHFRAKLVQNTSSSTPHVQVLSVAREKEIMWRKQPACLPLAFAIHRHDVMMLLSYMGMVWSAGRLWLAGAQMLSLAETSYLVTKVHS